MNVLSLFDGISCARVALDRVGIAVGKYYTCEIEPNAIEISQKNYPDCIRLGDVREIDGRKLGKIDLLIGGSPCQDLSIANKKRQGLNGERSRLFWEYVRLKNECNPKWFVFENVATMAKEDKDTITAELGVEPRLFDAALVSAQSRKRLFWTNIPFVLPEDRGILLKDIVEDVSTTYAGKDLTLFEKPRGNQLGYFGAKNRCGVGGQALRVYSLTGKAPTSGVGLFKIGDKIRRLTVTECERLQSLPDGYTSGVAKSHRLACLRNGFNVEVIAEILRDLEFVSEEQWKQGIELHGRF